MVSSRLSSKRPRCDSGTYIRVKPSRELHRAGRTATYWLQAGARSQRSRTARSSSGDARTPVAAVLVHVIGPGAFMNHDVPDCFAKWWRETRHIGPKPRPERRGLWLFKAGSVLQSATEQLHRHEWEANLECLSIYFKLYASMSWIPRTLI